MILFEICGFVGESNLDFGCMVFYLFFDEMINFFKNLKCKYF